MADSRLNNNNGNYLLFIILEEREIECDRIGSLVCERGARFFVPLVRLVARPFVCSFLLSSRSPKSGSGRHEQTQHNIEDEHDGSGHASGSERGRAEGRKRGKQTKDRSLHACFW